MKTTNKLAILSLLCLPLVLNAATYYVKPDGNDSAAGTSWATALATPNKGFAKVNSNKGSTLIISNGVYQLTGAIGCTGGSDEANRTIVKGFSGKPGDVILDAHGESEGLRLASYITVSGITISNGVNGAVNNGATCPAGGIRFSNTSGSTDYEIIVSNCVVTCCTNIFSGGRHGAAVDLIGHNLLVDSIIRNNTAVNTNGAGVIMVNRTDLKGPPKMLRCRVEGNYSAKSGAGVYISGNVNAENGKSGGRTVIEIEDCEIVGNTSANVGPGIFSPGYFDTRLIGCTIANNTVTTANGGGLRFEKGSVTMVNCIVENNYANSGAGVDIVPTAASPDSAIATLICSNTTFRGNTAYFTGGAVRIYQYARAFFDDCRFESNKTTYEGGDDNYGGGGVFLANQGSNSSSPYGYCSVSNCVFGGNVSACRGGGIGSTWNTNFCGAVVNCVFTNNKSRIQGGGLCIREAVANPTPAIIRNSLFAFNETTGTSGDSNGGGVLLVTKSNLVMENCTIVSNVTSYTSSGGLHMPWNGHLVNCIVAYNLKNGGSAQETINWVSTQGATFTNCCTYPSTATVLATSPGYINLDPKFVDPANGDFRLQPNSPCVDKGLDADWMQGRASRDLAGSVRISGEHVDIGCYEYYFAPGLLLMFR